jgi:hypothetical protein
MDTAIGAKRGRHLTAAGIFLLVAALVAGVASCAADSSPEPSPPVQYSLTVSSTEGGSVVAPGEGTSTYDEGEVVNLVAEADEGYRFVEWTGDVGAILRVDSASTAITMRDSYSITARFVRQYRLVVSSTAGGSVSVPGEATYAYNEGQVVGLVARAEQDYHFVAWTGDVSTVANVDAAVTSIVMKGDYAITASFAVDLYFWTDAYLALSGPATLAPANRSPCMILGIVTNIVVDSVRVDLPGGGSVLIPAYCDVYTPDIDQATKFRFTSCVPGMPAAGSEYIFTGLDAAGDPIPGARDTDIWLGVEPPNPPANLRAEVTEDGILVSWDESPKIPGSFDPASHLGNYQLGISRSETDKLVYGANGMPASSHLIPRDSTGFTVRDYGIPLSEMEDGTYYLHACVHSNAPEGSSGRGAEYICQDSGQTITFTIEDGEVAIE